MFNFTFNLCVGEAELKKMKCKACDALNTGATLGL